MQSTHDTFSAEVILLVDNGSLAPASILATRELAAALAKRLNRPIEATGLLHVSKVPAEKLNGIPAQTCLPRIRELYAKGVRKFGILPLFIGPSLAVHEYLPKILSNLNFELPEVQVKVAPVLCPSADNTDKVDRLARLCLRQIEAIKDYRKSAILLCDHGSPIAPVAAIRNAVAKRLQELAGAACSVTACSMERRDGDEYAFNDPLLEVALNQPEVAQAEKRILSLLFLFPGRHAGPGGDVDQIAKEVYPSEDYILTDPLGLLPEFQDWIAERCEHFFVHEPSDIL